MCSSTLDYMPPTEVQPDLPGTEVQPDKLQQIMVLARKMEELHLQQEELLSKLNNITEEGKQIQEQLLPDLMLAVGLTEFTLTSGRKIVVKRDYFANVSKDRMPAVKKWLAEHKMDAIVKAACVVDEKYILALQMANLPFELKESIHPQTLKALVKEQCQIPDSNFPKDLFGVFEKDMAYVKNP